MSIHQNKMLSQYFIYVAIHPKIFGVYALKKMRISFSIFSALLIFLFLSMFTSIAWSQLDETTLLKNKNKQIQEQAMNSADNSMMDHSHIPINVPEMVATPHLSINIYPDAMSGYNLIIETQNYTLIPPPHSELKMMELMKPTVNQNSGFVEGHAHLYVNGTKIQRVYGNSVYLPSELFRTGVNQITVSINNHAHMYWIAEDKQILATLFIIDDGKPTIKYSFASFPVLESKN